MKFKTAAALSGLFFATLILLMGTFWAFDRGAHDFAVFYASWRLVLSGWGSEIYHATPDRFLYAPGFAWLLSPLGWLKPEVALAFWCVVKILILIWIVREFSRRLPPFSTPLVSMGVASWALVLVARPLLIDFQYGQVNILILGACVWALLGHTNRKNPSGWDFIRWMALAIAAVAKIFPLPLLIVPWAVKLGIRRRKLRYERAGIVTGVLLILLAPIFQEGWLGTWKLMWLWRDALISKGLPVESHNQSFVAFLHHYFSSEPTHVIAEGSQWIRFGVMSLTDRTIALLASAWSLIAMGYVLAWTMLGSHKPTLKWVAVATALVIVPSHLIWKPYFILSLPMAILAMHFMFKKPRARDWTFIALVFVLINFTGFNFVGHCWSAQLEAASILLFIHLALIGFLVFRAPQVEL